MVPAGRVIGLGAGVPKATSPRAFHTCCPQVSGNGLWGAGTSGSSLPWVLGLLSPPKAIATAVYGILTDETPRIRSVYSSGVQAWRVDLILEPLNSLVSSITEQLNDLEGFTSWSLSCLTPPHKPPKTHPVGRTE
jgi:hypothetical protein